MVVKYVALQAALVLGQPDRVCRYAGFTYGFEGDGLPPALLDFASPTNLSRSFNPAMTSLSCKISSNSLPAFSSIIIVIWVCTDLSTSGFFKAGVGKHEENLSYVHAFNVCWSALWNTVES